VDDLSRGAELNSVAQLVGQSADGRLCGPLLPLIAAQARRADETRSVDPEVIAAIKRSDLLRMAAVESIGGVEASIEAIALELEAIAGACASTAWCLWNHLAVFHWYCEILGPEGADLLAGIVRDREWVSFPQGAGSAVLGRAEGDEVVLTGKATFGSGARYGDWAGTVFALESEGTEATDKPDLRFTVVRLDSPGVTIDANWRAMSVRASATDDVYYDAVRVPVAHVRPFDPNFAAIFRAPDVPALAPRYKEDWVPVCVLWLAAQGTGIAGAALRELAEGAARRRDIAGVNLAIRPSIQSHAGEAASFVASARSVVLAACAETDARIASGTCPTEADALRQLAHGTTAIKLCDEAMRLMLRSLGGNALREEGDFERRYRDFQAVPLHITGHPDRVHENVGRYLLQQESLPFAGNAKA
jgi:alkylation response protein AidB-like acyl-CoA dehydrogenase